MSSTINYKGKKIIISSGHMLPFHKFRRDFMENKFIRVRKSIEQMILKNSKIPMVIGSNMNYDDMDKLIPNIFKYGFSDAVVDTSTTPEGNQSDHIILTEHWKINSRKMIHVKADHYLCVADLELNR